MSKQNGVDADKYFKVYSLLIEEVKESLPDIKIMILEPFALQGSGNEKISLSRQGITQVYLMGFFGVEPFFIAINFARI